MSTRYQHITFRKLAVGEEFFTKKFRYTKSSFFTGRMVLDGELVFVSPWRKVRSARPFGKAKPDLLPLELRTLTGEGPVVDVRPPVAVTPGGDRTSETIGGSELTPSA